MKNYDLKGLKLEELKKEELRKINGGDSIIVNGQYIWVPNKKSR